MMKPRLREEVGVFWVIGGTQMGSHRFLTEGS